VFPSGKDGKYRIRARVENNVHSFFERQPRELTRLRDATLLDRAQAMALLWDFVVNSDEIAIEVTGE